MPTLYLFIGFPGAGKTTIAQALQRKTGAVHIWADNERHKLFTAPTHSLSESATLYTQLNQQAETLLREGKSVIFDTNFNFYGDRQKLREIATAQGADTVIIWVTTPEAVAKTRAVEGNIARNGYEVLMSEQQFDDIACKLEPPRNSEKVIKIDGTSFDERSLATLG